jgi:hypothetical protein
MPPTFSSYVFGYCRFGMKKVWTSKKSTLMELSCNYDTCELFSNLVIGKTISCKGFGAWVTIKRHVIVVKFFAR